MRILVDADACPVKEEIINIAKEFSAAVVMVVSLSHVLTVPASIEVVIVDNHPEAVDLEIARRTQPGDIVVTQDFGLAAMVLARRGKAISVRGQYLTDENIEYLLDRRHQGMKIRRAGGKTKGPTALLKADRQQFERALRDLLNLS